MKVAFLDPLEARLAEFPGRYLGGHEVLLTTEQGVLPEGIEDAEAIVWWSYPVDSALIERLGSLRFLQRIGLMRTRGDTTAALAKGIPVSTLPHGVSDRVAQHALALILSIMRKLRQSHNGMIAGDNPNNMPEEETGAPAIAMTWTGTENVDTLNDKTVGIIGFGEIGACLTRMLAPFDCRVLYHKRTPLTPELEAHWGGIEYVSLDEAMRQSDIVTAIVPYTEESRKMIGAREFGLMKPGSVFINVGRGNTVDEAALIEALNNGPMAHAGLDVFAVEPLPASSPLLQMDNVVLTPHSAGGVLGWVNTFERIAANLGRIEQGRPPIMPQRQGDPQWP